MINYFTGTGNSLSVALRLAELTGTKTVSIAELMSGKPMPEPEEVTGIVFPVYAWGAPRMVLEFLKSHNVKGSNNYAVCTCGDTAGHTMKKLEKALGAKLDGAWSIIMPNNYIQGADIDSETVIREKLSLAEAKIAAIAENVNARRRGVYAVTEGKRAALMSSVVNSAFNRFVKSATVYTVDDSCTGCGKCASVCPTQNIVVDKKPVWGNNCTACAACIHHCPERAIQQGNGTRSRGRYVNPNCTVKYDF